MYILNFFKTTLILSVVAFNFTAQAVEESGITPYKFTNKERGNGLAQYLAPSGSKFSVKRSQEAASEIVFYFTHPRKKYFPIAIICDGSSSKRDVVSVIHLHRYFLQNFLDLGIGVVTVEKWGSDDHGTNIDEFMRHYTLSQRLQDHEVVINHLIAHPPEGWNGEIVFLGISEGGPLVTSLTITYSQRVIATMNWSGASDWNWREEVWAFIEDEIKTMTVPWHAKVRSLLPKWFPFSQPLDILTREEYDDIMDQTLLNPTHEKTFSDMTYKYHADSLRQKNVDYSKIQTPYLVVSGAKDSAIGTSDSFVEKAQHHQVDVTYFRISDMDHFIIKRPDVIECSFAWLENKLYNRQKNSFR